MVTKLPSEVFDYRAANGLMWLGLCDPSRMLSPALAPVRSPRRLVTAAGISARGWVELVWLLDRWRGLGFLRCDRRAVSGLRARSGGRYGLPWR
jgi:hypothetical protein